MAKSLWREADRPEFVANEECALSNLELWLQQIDRRLNAMHEACGGNIYTTTLHAINSAIVKLSKLTETGKVWRGVSGGRLPEGFRIANAYGVKGGIEAGFMSTTKNKDVAMGYAASRGGPAVVFEAQQGMIDRGADIVFLSQCARRRQQPAAHSR